MSALTIPRLARTLQDVLSTQADRLARTTGFVQRKSKMTGALFAQTLVFAYLAHRHPTWDTLAQTAATLGVTISPSGLLLRCTQVAAQFLLALLETAASASLNLHAAPVAIPILQRFSAVELQDSTQVCLPAPLAQIWAGSRADLASLKLQVRLDYATGALHLGLCAGRSSDKTLPAEQRAARPGSLRLADLGYFDLHAMAQQAAAGAFWLMHVVQHTALYLGDGRDGRDVRRWGVLDLLSHREGHAARTGGLDLPVRLGVKARLPCRLLVRRVPRGVAAELARRLRAQARDQGEPVSATQLAMTRWVVFVTNVPAERLGLDEALVLARVRWQIELLFKLWKSHGAIDQSQHRKPYVVLCEVYAKLLAMLIQHWTLVVGLWHHPDRSLLKAAHVVRDRAMALAMNFSRLSALCRVLKATVASMAVGCRITKRKAVPATYQLLLALAELHET